ncbi:MAG TPA: hypothetical protein PK624_07580 [Spirochaetota bacterium]|nr:hypothetical protein [Spirochaetota bacterium]HOR44640.1 hypothetical protein [Spirochaetota bacterium]HPK56113.1 hypothetical protein [Spirochaetota bacterium]
MKKLFLLIPIAFISCSSSIHQKIIPIKNNYVVSSSTGSTIKTLYFDASVYYIDENNNLKKTFGDTTENPAFMAIVRNASENLLDFPSFSIKHTRGTTNEAIPFELIQNFRTPDEYKQNDEDKPVFIKYNFNFILPDDYAVFYLKLPSYIKSGKITVSVKMPLAKGEKIVDFEYTQTEYRTK